MKYKEIIDKALSETAWDSPLSEVIKYSLEAGGKRIRPILTLAFCEAYGSNAQSALPIAIAIELLHTSTLIQDDLPCMDDDDERRGKPACHKAFSESDALLAASAMAYKAIDLIAGCDAFIPPQNIMKIVKVICNYMGKVYDGQKLDLDSHEDIIRIYEHKTCALIQAACAAGVLAADADEKAVKNAHDFAYNLGMAFQLIDDILDNEGSENAAQDAEKYTREALNILQEIPNNEFLIQLTNELLHRSK